MGVWLLAYENQASNDRTSLKLCVLLLSSDGQLHSNPGYDQCLVEYIVKGDGINDQLIVGLNYLVLAFIYHQLL